MAVNFIPRASLEVLGNEILSKTPFVAEYEFEIRKFFAIIAARQCQRR